MRELEELTLKELRFIRDNYTKKVNIKQLKEAIDSLASKLDLNKENAFEAFKIATSNVIDMYVRKHKIKL